MTIGQIQHASIDNVHVLRFIGEIRYPMAPSVGRLFDSLIRNDEPRGMAIDLTQATLIDSTNLGQLARIASTMKKRFEQRVTLFSDREDINIVLTSMGLSSLFDVVEDAGSLPPSTLVEVENSPSSQKELAAVILAAHRALMALSKENQDRFRDMVELLEAETRATEAST